MIADEEAPIPQTHLALKLIAAAVAGLAALSAAPFALAKGGPAAVDAELVLAVDVSYSMDQEEQKLQRAGYAAALTSPDFLAALKSGPYGKIAVVYMEWASSRDTKVLLDWTTIDGAASASAFADKLLEAPYRRASRTSVSGAIDASMALFENNGFDGIRRVVDISGDGPNNNGRPVTMARDEAVAKGVTINGLPLLIRPVRAAYMDIDDLDIYYRDCVIGGPGSFMIPVKDAKAFTDATRTKLVMEIADRTPLPVIRVAATEIEKPKMSCTAGEDLWRRRYWGE